ncbi:ABC transporter ATP-binding protein [Tissierella carlieri]|nr:ABC transporter ATP-binding protein [Tissierella carlieri]
MQKRIYKEGRIMNKKDIFMRMLKYYNKYKFRYIISFIGYFIITAFCWNLILAFILKNILNSAITNDSKALFNTIIYSVTIILIGTIMQPFFIYKVKQYEINIINEIRNEVYKKIIRLKFSYFDTNHSGEAISRCIDSIKGLSDFYGGRMINVFYNIFVGVVAVSIAIILDWRLGLTILVLGCLDAFINYKFSEPVSNLYLKSQKINSKQTERLQDILKNIQLIKSFNISAVINRQYIKETDSFIEVEYNANKVLNKLNIFSTLFEYMGSIGLLIFGLYLLIIDSSLDVGTVAAITVLQGNANLFFIGVKDLISNLRYSIECGKRVFEIFDYEDENRSIKIVEPTNDLAITISNVSFSYYEKLVLENITLDIPRGLSIAFVGYSGSGKSTLNKLLLGFYDTYEGQIFINGYNIENISYEDLREQFAYVPQSNYLLNMSIKENIKIGKQDATDEEIISAAKAVNIHEFIKRMPEQYDTFVGELGDKLSGGQRQRILLARAILKEANIFIFDESTSNLDSENEEKINKLIIEKLKKHTIISVAHRLSSIKKYDIICFFENGLIVEKGSHDELIALNGKYKELWDIQSSAN